MEHSHFLNSHQLKDIPSCFQRIYTTKMSQEQPRRTHQEHEKEEQKEPIKYGDVFKVVGELASKPIAPQDAAMMQKAENMILGQTQKGGPASVMQAAATRNERAGVVGHKDFTDVTGDRGVTVSETDVPGSRIITESVAGQAVGQYAEATPVLQTSFEVTQESALTIGEALEASAQSAGNKPVDQSDAAAIQAAEVRATGSNVIIPGGLAATAQSAATHNARVDLDEYKIKLRDILMDATAKLPADKAVTRQDAEGVVSAELRNNQNLATHPGGVASAVTVAARLNENVNV
ncbi:late embryogenesis abundant protein D-34-like [Quercus lobata]|uniref:late embryogenesis abundant protein D-34-like n=1 Tax=Quercus lobata TaxID=97700 RepID=UPI001248750C|nr:late embryogenesis abundant protein D-34-like [Quercus lobata]